MSIKLELSNEQFIKFFGDNEYVIGFSDEAINIILDRMSDMQDEVDEPCSIGWTGFFSEACEMTADDVYNDYQHNIYDNFEDVVEMARGVDFEGELNDLIENQDELSDSELLKSLIKQMEENEDYILGAASILAKHNDVIELENESFLKFH